MHALAVTPGQARSACLLNIPEPGPEMGSLLVETLAIGICGTDVEIVSGRYGWPPQGRERLIIGHESIGRVLDHPRAPISHPVIADVITRSAPSGVVCLTGVSSGGHAISLDLGSVNRSMVLENDVVFGSVNANRAHYEAGAVALARAERAWLSALITRRVPLADWQDAFERRSDDVKVIIDFNGAA